MLFSQIDVSVCVLTGGVAVAKALLATALSLPGLLLNAHSLGAQSVPWVLLGDAEPAPDVNPLVQFLPMIVIGLFFYFILMRPQQKESRRRKELLAGLKKNDKVVTAGGIYGTIVDVSGDGKRVTLKVDDNTRIKFARSSITGPADDQTD